MRPAASFDDLVGAGEDRWRHGQAERLGGVEVDDQFKCRRLLHWQIGRLGALKDLSGINAGLVIGSREARSVADQAAGSRKFTRLIDRRKAMARRQLDELAASAEEERIGADDERAGLQLDEGCESGIDLAFGAGL